MQRCAAFLRNHSLVQICQDDATRPFTVLFSAKRLTQNAMLLVADATHSFSPMHREAASLLIVPSCRDAGMWTSNSSLHDSSVNAR